MARVEKYTHSSVIYELRHNFRESPKPSKNIDIDTTRSFLNYSLHPSSHGCSAVECKHYYDQRLAEVYHYRRADIKTMCQWIVTAPQDLKAEDRKLFFRETYNFLNGLYGEKNCISAIVHFDEGIKDKSGNVFVGQPHLHYLFIPVVANNKYMKKNKKGHLTTMSVYEEKVCANELLTKNHLKLFHKNFSQFLKSKHIKCSVYSGITNGKNRSVKDLKTETREFLEKNHVLEKENTTLKEKIHDLEKENATLKENIISLKHDISKLHEREIEKPAAWGNTSGWGKEFSKSWEPNY